MAQEVNSPAVRSLSSTSPLHDEASKVSMPSPPKIVGVVRVRVPTISARKYPYRQLTKCSTNRIEWPDAAHQPGDYNGSAPTCATTAKSQIDGSGILRLQTPSTVLRPQRKRA